MPRLMAGHRTHLGKARLFQRDIRNRDPRRRADAGNIGGEAVGLARAVIHEDPVFRDTDIVGDLLQRGAHLARRHGLVFVEQRLDQRRAGEQAEQRDDPGKPAAPQPPALSGAADQDIDPGQKQAAQ